MAFKRIESIKKEAEELAQKTGEVYHVIPAPGRYEFFITDFKVVPEKEITASIRSLYNTRDKQWNGVAVKRRSFRP